MALQGGYRKPENPAPSSGPGALSQRTDGGPAQGAKYIPGLPYGQGQETYAKQTAAPAPAGRARSGLFAVQSDAIFGQPGCVRLVGGVGRHDAQPRPTRRAMAEITSGTGGDGSVFTQRCFHVAFL